MARLRWTDLRHAVRSGLVDPLDLAPPEDISERALTALVIAVAQGLGWRVYHPRPARERSGEWCTPVAGDGSGYPDLTLVRHRLVYVELKSQTGRLSDDQRAWLDALSRVPGVVARVIRPSDWTELIHILR
jgi:hypothetical protein